MRLRWNPWRGIPKAYRIFVAMLALPALKPTPVLYAYHRYGFTDWLTAGWRTEGDPHHLNLGLLAGIGTPLGQVEMALAGSAARGEPGEAVSFLYSYITPLYSIGGSASVFSAQYWNLAMVPQTDKP